MVADSQKQGKAHSGGQRIDDHSFWGGKQIGEQVLPGGGHKLKSESSDGHEGYVANYEDTSEKIKEQQEMSGKKVKGHAQKPLHRY